MGRCARALAITRSKLWRRPLSHMAAGKVAEDSSLARPPMRGVIALLGRVGGAAAHASGCRVARLVSFGGAAQEFKATDIALSALTEGENQNKFFAAVILAPIARKDDTPVSFLVADAEANVSVLSL